MMKNPFIKIINTFKKPLTEEKIIDQYFLSIILISIIRDIFLLVFFKESYSLLLFNSLLIPIIMFVIDYKYKTNIIFLTILFYYYVFIATYGIFNFKDRFLGYELYYYNFIARMFLLLDARKYPIYFGVISVTVLIVLLFVMDSNISVDTSHLTYQDKKHSFSFNLFITYFATFSAVFFIYKKYTFKIDISEENISLKDIEIKKISDHNMLQLIDLAKQDNSNFINKFIQINPEFNKNFIQKNINLSQNDIKFCAMVYLNLTNKEISKALQLEYRSVITKKYNLRKKLQLPEDITLEDWIKNV